MSVAILIPVLARPDNVLPVLTSIRETTPEPYRVLFICDPNDRPEQDAIAWADGEMISPGGNYASKIRAGIAATDEPLVFLAADDLRFRLGWFPAARKRLIGNVQVVGVNDLIRRRRRLHATHFLMTRSYALMPTIDGMPGPLSSAYAHNYVDDELIATAEHRGVYEYVPSSVVEHRHPLNRKAVKDSTYLKGDASFEADHAIFTRRTALWA